MIPGDEASKAVAGDVEALRRVLFDAAMNHIAFDGWSWTALYAAGRDVGVDRLAVENAFPDGPDELLEYFGRQSDLDMLAALDPEALDKSSMRERVATAIRVRLDQKVPHKEAVRRCLSVLSMPQKAGLSLRMLSRTADAIRAAAGDTGSGAGAYGRRAAIGGLYIATLLYWLEDRSPRHEATYAFLDRQADQLFKGGDLLGRDFGRLTGGTRRARLMSRRFPRREFRSRA